MARSKWKIPHVNLKLLKKSFFSKEKKIKIWNRSLTIPSILVNKTILVHSGNTFKSVFITREKVGFKFGEFVFTRKHGKKKIKKKKK